jgi:putative hydrolase of the HAD superfamily
MLPRDLDAIFFDAGGTLVHVDYDRIVELAGHHGVVLDRARMPHGDAAARRAVDRRLAALRAELDRDDARVPGYFEALLLGAGAVAEVAAELARVVEAAHRESNLWSVPFADAATTLAELRDHGLALAVISNADGRVRAVLERAGLTEHLDFVVDSHEEGVEKPDPEIFRRALARAGAAPERALYVGDIYSVDVAGARAAGLTPCLLDPTGGYRDADCLRLAALADLVRALEG